MSYRPLAGGGGGGAGAGGSSPTGGGDGTSGNDVVPQWTAMVFLVNLEVRRFNDDEVTNVALQQHSCAARTFNTRVGNT